MILLEEDNMLLLPSHDWYLYFILIPRPIKVHLSDEHHQKYYGYIFASSLCSPTWSDMCVSISSLYFCPPPSPFQSYSQAGVNLKVLTTLCDGDSEVKLRCLASAMEVTRRPRTSCLMGSISLSSTTWRWVEPVTLETKTQLNFNKVKV